MGLHADFVSISSASEAFVQKLLIMSEKALLRVIHTIETST